MSTVAVYGYIKTSNSLVIGNDERKIYLGSYGRATAAKILTDETFITRWNNEHPANIHRLSIEIEN